MTLVLGIDAAWSSKNPSGVALVAIGPGKPHLIRAAPSYEHFVQNVPPEHWDEKLAPSASFSDLLAEAAKIVDDRVGVVAVDMPLARTPVRSRRTSDLKVSKTFGGRGCSTHTPTKERPGLISDDLLREAKSAGFSLRTTVADGVHGLTLLEVYPHVALLVLCESPYRIPYKLSRRHKYWPKDNALARLDSIKSEWDRILARLQTKIDFELDIDCMGKPLHCWKAWEDAIDAIICCWVGLEWLSGRAKPYGDDSAAIWVPVLAESKNDVA
jgi:predicted RNase H-like nuclease